MRDDGSPFRGESPEREHDEHDHRHRIECGGLHQHLNDVEVLVVVADTVYYERGAKKRCEELQDEIAKSPSNR